MAFVMLDDFLNDEFQDSFGEFRVEIGALRQIFEPSNLCGFSDWIRRRQGVLGFELTHRLGVFEPLAERINEDSVEPID